NDHPGCESWFLGKGIWDSFLAEAHSAKYIDFSPNDIGNFDISKRFTFSGIGLGGMPHSDFNIHDLLDPRGVVYPGGRLAAYAAGFWTQKTIAVGNSFEFGRSEQGKDETIVHEVLHLFYN